MRLLPFLFCLCASSAFAQLTWDKTDQTFNATPEDQAVVAKYKFTNTGSKGIKLNVISSCGCTTAALTKTEYAPNESGEIEAKFTFSGRTGRQYKEIVVGSSATPGQPTILKLHVFIQEPVSVEPQLVLWRVGEQPAPKAIRIAIAGDKAVRILSVVSDNPAIKVKLREITPGKEYEAQVIPDTSAQRASATLFIRTDYPTDNPRIRYAYARIK